MSYEINLIRSGSMDAASWPENVDSPLLFRASLKLGTMTGGELVAQASRLKDYIEWDQLLQSEVEDASQTFSAPSFFLVSHYDRQSVNDAVAGFFKGVRTGGNFDELLLKASIMFSYADFWDYIGMRLDKNSSPLHYSISIVGLHFQNGIRCNWELVAEATQIDRECTLELEIKFPNRVVPLAIQLMPREHLYSKFTSLATPFFINRGIWGLSKISKQFIDTLIKDWYSKFEGSSEEEILLKWALMVQVPNLQRLLWTPITNGEPNSLAEDGIGNDYFHLKDRSTE